MQTNLFIANYIVRLYRFRKNKRSSLVGVVEKVGAKGKRAFTNYDELWDILNAPRGVSSPGKNPMKKDSKKRGMNHHKRKEGGDEYEQQKESHDEG